MHLCLLHGMFWLKTWTWNCWTRHDAYKGNLAWFYNTSLHLGFKNCSPVNVAWNHSSDSIEHFPSWVTHQGPHMPPPRTPLPNQETTVETRRRKSVRCRLGRYCPKSARFPSSVELIIRGWEEKSCWLAGQKGLLHTEGVVCFWGFSKDRETLRWGPTTQWAPNPHELLCDPQKQ